MRRLVLRAASIIGLALIAALALFASEVWAQKPPVAEKPLNLAGQVLAGGIQLNWEPPAARAAEVDGYQVYRKRPDAGETLLLVLVANTGSTATSYLDATATEPGVSYIYRVRARRGTELSRMANKVQLTYTAPEPALEPIPAPTLETTPTLEPIPALDPEPAGVTVELGDITELEKVRFPRGVLDGGAETVNTYRFTITELKTVGLGLRRQETNADLVLVDAKGAELRAARQPGTANEWITVNLPAGDYEARIEAQEAGVSNYMFRYGVSSEASTAVSVTPAEPQPTDTTRDENTITPPVPPDEPELPLEQHIVTPGRHIRTITLPFGPALSSLPYDPELSFVRVGGVPVYTGGRVLAPEDTALPEERIGVYLGNPYYLWENFITAGDRWTPSGLWSDGNVLWVVDPIHFGAHPLKLDKLLNEGVVELHRAQYATNDPTSPADRESDLRIHYHCHLNPDVVGGEGNPELTEIWGNANTIWVANNTNGQLNAYHRGAAGTGTPCNNLVRVVGWIDADPADAPRSAATASVGIKAQIRRDSSKDFSLWLSAIDMLVVRGIWSDDTTMWLNGPVLRVAATTAPSPPAGMYTLNMATNQLTRAPGFDGASGGAGIWSDGDTMWVAKPGWLRAYHLGNGSRRAELDLQLPGIEPDGIWSPDGETILITSSFGGSIDAYRLPTLGH